MTGMTLLPAKVTTTETYQIGKDFSGRLLAGETITSVTVAVEVIRGVDPDSADFTSGAYQIGTQADGVFTPDANGPVVMQRIQQGLKGCGYRVWFHAATSLGNVYAEWDDVFIPRNP
jgi:hypothetical protein